MDQKRLHIWTLFTQCKTLSVLFVASLLLNKIDDPDFFKIGLRLTEKKYYRVHWKTSDYFLVQSLHKN